MRTIIVPLEKCKMSRDDGRSRDHVDTVGIDMETGSDKQGHLKGDHKEKDEGDDRDYNDGFPPGYVIWAQFMGSGGSDDEGGVGADDRTIFIRKVFLIMFFLCGITAAITYCFTFMGFLKEWVFDRPIEVFMIPLFVLLLINYAITCLPCVKVFPVNVIILLVGAICYGVVCGSIANRFDENVVLAALGATAIVVLLCFILAFSSFDFTKYMLYIVMVAASVSSVALVYVVARFALNIHIKEVHVAILCISVIITTVVFALQLQMIIGQRTVELTEDEFILGAYMIYTSLISIFVNLVQVVDAL